VISVNSAAGSPHLDPAPSFDYRFTTAFTPPSSAPCSPHVSLNGCPLTGVTG
jgi:hypothetical protein